MVTVSRHNLPLLFQCTLFLIPVNIYIIGDWLAAGVQWVLFRYLQSDLGNSGILFINDLFYIQKGLLKEVSAVAAVVNVTATCVMMLAVLLHIIAYDKESGILVKRAAIATIAGGFLYLIADMIQYGIAFHGPAGFVIPIGIPAILFAGVWMYRADFTNSIAARPEGPETIEEENPQ